MGVLVGIVPMLDLLGYHLSGSVAVTVVLSLWLFWTVGHLLLMLFFVPNTPSCNGVRIFIPEYLKAFLTPEQLAAVRCHEMGHLKRFHAWKNFLLVCVFLRPSQRRRQRQELEADDYAVRHGQGLALAEVLRQRSTNPFDIKRAERLEALCSNR